ncbi:MAG: glycosyltransferase family 39 protein [Planctomycetia bacterium]|nr:glycosyltransferase family 39 protein [Planctomycetia bacterium]
MDGHRFASYRGLFLAVAVAAALQAAIIVRSPTVTADGIIFVSVAKDLSRAPIETFRNHDQHPGFPAMLLAGTRAVQAMGYRAEPESWMIGGQIVAFIFGVLSVSVVWLFARDLFGVQVANLAAFVFAILPQPRDSASDAMSDTPHLLFYLLAAWLASSAIVSGRIWLLSGAGLASGIAYWIRPEGLEVMLVALACLVWQSFHARWGFRRLGLASAALAGTTLIVAAPYFVLAGKVTSKQHPLAKAQLATTFIAQLAKAAPATENSPITATTPLIESVRSAPPSGPQTIRAPGGTATRREKVALVSRLVGRALVSFVNSICQGFKWVFLPLYLVGHVELVRRKPRWLPIAFVALLGALHVLALLGLFMGSGYIAHRHVLPLVSLAMPFTALGIVYSGEKLAALTKLSPFHGALATLGLCSAVVLPYTLRPFCDEFVPVIKATRWVQAHAEPGSGIICNSPYVGFYGTLPTMVLGSDAPTLEAAVAKAAGGARYDFVVLHVGAFAYQPAWLAEVQRFYHQVQEFPDPLSGARPKKVLVFEANDRQARRAQPASPS